MKTSNIEVEYIDHCGSDASVVRAARVSFAGDNKEFDEVKDSKLIQYLAKHKHKSPFNHAFVTVKVKAPIFVSRQLVKHKFLPWNEESRRYINTEPEFYIPSDYRGVAANAKQGSSDTIVEGLMYICNRGDGDKHGNVEDAIKYSCEESLKIYQALLNKGVCNEQARMVLPQNMMVNWYWSGTLGAFADMLILRLDPHTQLESRVVAGMIKDIVQPLFPVSLSALLENK